jgi:hypothetical protein
MHHVPEHPFFAAEFSQSRQRYRINSDIRDTSVSAIALVFSFFQYARPLLFWALHIDNDWPAVRKNKKNSVIPQNGSVSYI